MKRIVSLILDQLLDASHALGDWTGFLLGLSAYLICELVALAKAVGELPADLAHYERPP